MKLSRDTFEHRYKSGNLRLAFIGMSNIGKSYTANRLANDYDFKLIEVDKLIWEKLGHSDMKVFAEWQGQPYSDGYKERELQSIQLETDATQKALEHDLGNHILDTTGSVIYTGKETLQSLQDTHYVVYIEASKDSLERLKVQYFSQPKPLIWNGFFDKKAEQSNQAAILECYPKLLNARAKAYQALADNTLSSEFILDPSHSTQDIFEALKPSI